MTAKTLGPRIRRLRELKRLKQVELAKIMGVKPSAANEWEMGETRPSIDKLPRLAAALGVSIDALLASDEQPTSAPQEAAS